MKKIIIFSIMLILSGCATYIPSGGYGYTAAIYQPYPIITAPVIYQGYPYFHHGHRHHFR